MSVPVFVLSPADASGLRPGKAFILDGSEGRHAAGSMRLEPGESLDLIDGDGTRARAVIERSEKVSLQLRITEITQEPAPTPPIALVQALAKNGRDEQAIEAAVELGVNTIIPWQADRSIVRWREDKAAKGQAKWQELVRAATKQSRQSHVPHVAEILTSKALATEIGHAIAASGNPVATEATLRSGGHVVVLHESADVPLVTFLREAEPAPLTLVVGPEGGISEEEIAALRESGTQIVSLGSRILRSSSAGPAAIATVNTVWERW